VVLLGSQSDASAFLRRLHDAAAAESSPNGCTHTSSSQARRGYNAAHAVTAALTEPQLARWCVAMPAGAFAALYASYGRRAVPVHMCCKSRTFGRHKAFCSSFIGTRPQMYTGIRKRSKQALQFARVVLIVVIICTCTLQTVTADAAWQAALSRPALQGDWRFPEPLRVCFVSLLDFRCARHKLFCVALFHIAADGAAIVRLLLSLPVRQNLKDVYMQCCKLAKIQ
jgi:hypothetical protein